MTMERLTASATNKHNGYSPRLPFTTTTTATISLHQKPPKSPFPPPNNHHQQQKPATIADHRLTELGIFSAERYFKEEDLYKDGTAVPSPSPLKKPHPFTSTILPLHYYPTTPSFSSNTQTRTPHHHLPISATTASSSEVSWNSQTGLLPHHSSSLSSTPRRPQKWRFLYPPSCACFGKRSVDVEDKFSEFKSSYLSSSAYPSSKHATFVVKEEGEKNPPPPPVVDEDVGYLVSAITKLKILPGKWEKAEEPFSLHDSNATVAASAAFAFPKLAKPAATAGAREDNGADPPRNSLEVFRPRESNSSPSAVTPRRMSVDLLSRWTPCHPSTEEVRRSFTFSGREDDVASDASSDLFEIESFSTNTAPVYGRCETPEEVELLGEREERARSSGGYPPSEVSVQWSVTTAEGCASLSNFSSSVSQCGGVAAEREAWGGGGVAARRKKHKKKGGGVGLLRSSCRNTRAIDVAPQIARQMTDEEGNEQSGPQVVPLGPYGPVRPAGGMRGRDHGGLGRGQSCLVFENKSRDIRI